MNILHALTQLGYVNIEDFMVEFDEQSTSFIITEWKHTDNIPSYAALQIAWEEWLALHGPSLDDMKYDAKHQLDQSAERARQRHVTSGSAQAMVYQEKGDEAADYVANNYPGDLSSYPFIQAEVNATGKTAAEASDNILTQKSAWIAIGAAVEEVRIGGKINIDAAVDEAAVEVARDIAITALEAI